MWTDRNPYLNGFFEPLANEVVISDLRIEGEIPEELDGTLYRATSNQHFEPLNPDQHHWFDGDGMVHAFHLRDGRAAYCNRWVIDDGARIERLVGHALYNGTMGRSGKRRLALPAGAPEIKVPSNINVVTVGGKVLALNENSTRYWEVEPRLLDTLGAFDFSGAFADFGDKGMLTAHPHYDAATGEFLFTCINAEDLFMDCFAVTPGAQITWRHRVAMDAPSWIHDFSFTESKLVFLLGTLNCRAREPGRIAAGLGMTFHDPKLRPRIMLVDRKTGARTLIEDQDLYMVTHFLNAYEDEGGQVHVFAGLSRMEERPASLVVSDFFPFPMPNKEPSPFSGPELHHWRINPAAGTARHERVGDFNGEFYRVNDAVYGRHNRFGYLAADYCKRGNAPGFNCLIKTDLLTGRFECQALSDRIDMVPGEPVFVPKHDARAEDEGWVLAVWGDPQRNASEVAILDAQDFGGRPLARIKLDHHLTNGFHGNWISRAQREAGARAAGL